MMTSVLRRWPAPAMLGAAILAAGFAAGCVSAEPKDRPPPQQPSWARPSTILISTSFPEDTNGNRYLDQIGVTVYLFDDQFAAAPLRTPGSFTFTLKSGDGAPIREWIISAEEADKAVRPMPPGPGYIFRLSLLKDGTDEIEVRNAELFSVFTPKEGEPVRGKALTVTIGPAGIRPMGR